MGSPRWINYGVAWLLLIALTGCATTSPTTEPIQVTPAKSVDVSQSQGWWYARFRPYWPEETWPSFYVDAYIAHQVILPVLVRYGYGIELWRFHRRAARDGAGHQFSFIFYTSPQHAAAIFDTLQANALLKELTREGVLDKQIFDAVDVIKRPDIEDTSDSNWSPLLQQSWPYFIMGVSRLWVDLIDRIAADFSARLDQASTQEKLEIYKEINDIVTGIWQVEGKHAFLHHLNALFGYQPMNIRF